MNQRNARRSLENLAALLLFGVFAVSVLTTLLLGAGIYQRLTERDRRSYELRTCVQYVTTRVRQADRPGGVRVEEFGGGDCLSFPEELDGRTYTTRVYCYGGWLMELLADEGTDLPPESGEPVMKLERLETELSDGLLTVTVCGENGDYTFALSLRGGEVTA